jgi:hypothetical protein
MQELWYLWAFVGWGFSSAAMMHFWLPDPPPPDLRAYVIGSIAGAVGGVIGGFVAISANPRPGHLLLPAVAGAALLLALVQVVFRAKSTR